MMTIGVDVIMAIHIGSGIVLYAYELFTPNKALHSTNQEA